MFFQHNLKNEFDFFLRNKITFSRKNYLQKQRIEDILRDIYYFHIFNRCFSKKYEKISILDIGSKNWEYVKGEYCFFNSFSKNFSLNGIELDAHRLNTHFYSRYEIAKFHTKGLVNTKYIIGDLMNHKEKYDYIIWILPFVSEYPLLQWGLPLKYFKPEKMLRHTCKLLKDKGELLIINQGKEEYLIQQKLNKKLNLNVKYFQDIPDEFNLFQHKRYCSKIINQKIL